MYHNTVVITSYIMLSLGMLRRIHKDYDSYCVLAQFQVGENLNKIT